MNYKYEQIGQLICSYDAQPVVPVVLCEQGRGVLRGPSDGLQGQAET